MKVAETEAPWGEAAENLRALYLSYCIMAASDGYTKEAREQASGEARKIWTILNGYQPPRQRPPRAADFVR